MTMSDPVPGPVVGFVEESEHVYTFMDEQESNLVTHARRELELIGEDPEFVAGYLEVISAFAKMGHSGGSASVAIPVINSLLQYKNLSPLTDNPDEWMHLTEEEWPDPEACWQNIRNSECFSRDGGKTYTSLKDKNTVHTSEPFKN